MFKETRQNGLGKLGDGFDLKGVVGGRPWDNMCDRRILHDYRYTSSISISFSIKSGVWLVFDFFTRDLLIGI